ncbi:hypothetical protein FDP41_004334 [Naegleria fowleri]|uniref:RRM domain-containing protein n=1 Tax=Naegleria fowleri TaxID=5763 RepID=A0A6A5BSR9_NAEFO|nr:uncharacterized protein FDP41_004334 [Naegleria fowleri]KAF0976435.1 hypothetical protein FDP41_004334 [Naegleria fowleri]CAG4716101.1 unnamed protein product [Naegleria fowleri]
MLKARMKEKQQQLASSSSSSTPVTTPPIHTSSSTSPNTITTASSSALVGGGVSTNTNTTPSNFGLPISSLMAGDESHHGFSSAMIGSTSGSGVNSLKRSHHELEEDEDDEEDFQSMESASKQPHHSLNEDEDESSSSHSGTNNEGTSSTTIPNAQNQDHTTPVSTGTHNSALSAVPTGSSSTAASTTANGSAMASYNGKPLAPPSKVLLFSNLPVNCQKSEVLEFDLFPNECKFQKVFLFKQPASTANRSNTKKRKREGYLAFVEFESIEKAQLYLSKFEDQKIKIRGKTVYLKFSEKQQLEGSSNASEEDLTVTTTRKNVVNTNNATILHITFTHCDEYRYPMNAHTLYNLFNKFGTIEKINIFIKNELTQALIQFSQPNEATEALREMESVFVHPDLKLYRMNIQFSKKYRDELVIKENNDRNRDYTQPSGTTSGSSTSGKPHDRYNAPSNQSFYATHDQQQQQQHDSSSYHYPESKSASSYHHSSSGQYNSMSYSSSGGYYQPMIPGPNANGSSSSGPLGMMLPPYGSSSSNEYLPPSSGSSSSSYPVLPPHPTAHHGIPQPHHGIPQQFPPSLLPMTPPPSLMPPPAGTCVLIVKNLPSSCTCDHLFVLFGLYGDVIKVSISLSKKDHKTPFMAFVQFKYPHEVANALRFLGAPYFPPYNSFNSGMVPSTQGCTLFGKQLHIEPSLRIFDIVPPRSSKSKETDGSKDVIFKSYENSPLHRFTPRQGTHESFRANYKKVMNICPPSNVLHISNVSGTTTEDKIRREIDKLFIDSSSGGDKKAKSRIVDFKFIDYKKTQTSDHKLKEKKSAIIEMDSTDSATTVLVELHDISIDSHHLNIKFSNRNTSSGSNYSDTYYNYPPPSHHDDYQRSNRRGYRRSGGNNSNKEDKMPQSSNSSESVNTHQDH